jgi:hypothetical protein
VIRKTLSFIPYIQYLFACDNSVWSRIFTYDNISSFIRFKYPIRLSLVRYMTIDSLSGLFNRWEDILSTAIVLAISKREVNGGIRVI